MSSGLSRVPMMESADQWGLLDYPLVGRLDRPWLRGVLFKREMCAAAVVIAEVTSNNPSEVILAQNDDVIEAVSAKVPISLSTYGLCQGDRAAVITSRIPIDRTRPTNS